MGLTQEEFGKRCRVTKGYISRLESGERENPSDVFLRNCCDAFSMPLEWLENGVGQLPIVDQTTASQPRPAAETRPDKPVNVSQSDLTGFMRVLLETVPMSGETLLKLTAQVWESPELSDDFKSKLVLGANIAFGERESGRKPDPK